MIDMNLIYYFIVVSKSKTLSEAAERCHISQPALSKAMKKLESQLEVPLFERSKNKMVLNNNGEYFKKTAKKLLNQYHSTIGDLREYDNLHRMIHIGVCAPIMLEGVKNHFPGNNYEVEMVSDIELLNGLDSHKYQFIITHEEIDEYYHKVCGDEQLYVSLPPAHPLAGYDEVSYEDLNGLTMLRMKNVGFWDHITKPYMPDTRFILQESREEFFELANASTLPIFTSDHYIHKNITVPNRVNIPIKDNDAYHTYYLNCLWEDKDYYKDIFDIIDINYFD